MTDIFPCIDCITLGTCKAIMREQFSFSHLAGRCSLFDDYDFSRNMEISGMEKTIFLLNFFKPIHYKRRIALRKEVIERKGEYGL